MPKNMHTMLQELARANHGNYEFQHKGEKCAHLILEPLRDT